MITKQTAITKNTILFHNDAVAVGIVVDDAAYVTENGKKLVKAGTPMNGDLTARTTAFTKAVTAGSATKGVYTVQMKTKAAVDDIITIEGINYTCKDSENIDNKEFAGADIAAQITSLLTMVTCNDFDVAAKAATTDTLQFTQKVAATGNEVTVTAIKGGSGTIVIGNVVVVTPAVEGTAVSNAVGILQHDVDVTAGNNNGSLILRGEIDLNKVDTTTAALITAEVKTALIGRLLFLK